MIGVTGWVTDVRRRDPSVAIVVTAREPPGRVRRSPRREGSANGRIEEAQPCSVEEVSEAGAPLRRRRLRRRRRPRSERRRRPAHRHGSHPPRRQPAATKARATKATTTTMNKSAATTPAPRKSTATTSTATKAPAKKAATAKRTGDEGGGHEGGRHVDDAGEGGTTTRAEATVARHSVAAVELSPRPPRDPRTARPRPRTASPTRRTST